MSDRREAVEAAIDNALARRVELDDDQQRDRLIAALADAALAAMDAEPTEAEIEAACPECGGHGRGCSFCGGTGDWPRTSEPTEAEIDAAMEAGAAVWSAAWANGWGCTIDAADWKPEQRNAMRAALIAARKARQGGER